MDIHIKQQTSAIKYFGIYQLNNEKYFIEITWASESSNCLKRL